MRTLNPIDADMVYAEQPTWRLHVGAVLLLDPPKSGSPVTFDGWAAQVGSRIDRAGPMRDRVVTVPFGLGPPVWVADPDFDLAAHLRHVRAPAPGGDRELAAVVGDFAGGKLDRRRPLWEMWFVDGLAAGRVALLAKVHHAVADGVAAAILLGQFLDGGPGSLPTEPPTLARRREPVPSQLALLLGGLGSAVRSPLRALGPLQRSLSSVGGVIASRRSADGGAPALPFQAPRMAFNRPVTANRSFAFASVPLVNVKAVERAVGGTVNDVVLALCASALRRYLDIRRELPDRPMTAAVPVSTRGPAEMGSYGNRVSGLFTKLPVDVADPVERLSAARHAAEDAKRLYASGVEDAVIGWAGVPPPITMSLGARLYTPTTRLAWVPPIFNLLVSNVPGSPVPLYFGDAPVAAVYPLGPVFDDVGLNISILSHVDRIGFGLVSCPELMPDLWVLADAIPAALAELVAAAGSPTQSSARPSTQWSACSSTQPTDWSGPTPRVSTPGPGRQSA